MPNQMSPFGKLIKNFKRKNLKFCNLFCNSFNTQPVLWGQDEKNVTLKIELRSVESPDINLDEKGIRFQSIGIGQQGANDYQFDFDFFDQIDPEVRIRNTNLVCN